MRPYVIGNPDCVLGFSLAGVGGKIVRTAEELADALRSALNDRSIGIILVSSDVAVLAREQIDHLKATSISPLVLEVPGPGGGVEAPSLREMVQRSVGISLGGKSR